MRITERERSSLQGSPPQQEAANSSKGMVRSGLLVEHLIEHGRCDFERARPGAKRLKPLSRERRRIRSELAPLKRRIAQRDEQRITQYVARVPNAAKLRRARTAWNPSAETQQSSALPGATDTGPSARTLIGGSPIGGSMMADMRRKWGLDMALFRCIKHATKRERPGWGATTRGRSAASTDALNPKELGRRACLDEPDRVRPHAFGVQPCILQDNSAHF